MSISYLPPVKPSAIALGTIFTQATSLAVMGPLFGDTYEKSKKSNSTQQFLHSKEATTSASLFAATLVGSGFQSYAMGALLNATGTLSIKGAAYVGGLVWACNSVGGILGGFMGNGGDGQASNKQTASDILVTALAGMVDTVGLATVLSWWGTRTGANIGF